MAIMATHHGAVILRLLLLLFLSSGIIVTAYGHDGGDSTTKTTATATGRADGGVSPPFSDDPSGVSSGISSSSGAGRGGVVVASHSPPADVVDAIQHVDESHRRLRSCFDAGSTTPCPACYNTKSCCMQTNFNIYGGSNSLGCTSNSLEFVRVTNFTVFDPLATKCNCNCRASITNDCSGARTVDCDAKGVAAVSCYSNGKNLPMDTVFGACRGIDDVVEVQFKVDVMVKGAEYDVGLYINLDGGSAQNGNTCMIAGLTPFTGIVGSIDNDACLDFAAAGTLYDYPFEKVTLSCTDSGGDGLLDFSVAASFFQSTGDPCDLDGPKTISDILYPPPYPGTSSKCWAGQRITLNINVPPFKTPSAEPSISFAPSIEPTTSAVPSSIPSLNPSISIKPSEYPSMNPSITTNPSSIPSLNPSISIQPSEYPSLTPSDSPTLKPSVGPSISIQPSEYPSMNPSISANPSSIPSEHPSITTKPSLAPSESPTTSNEPSGIPSESPSVTTKPSISVHPSSNTRWPSDVPSRRPSLNPTFEPTLLPSFFPSISRDPTPAPSDAPSISKQPTVPPTYYPSSEPSDPPTASLYYPDWENTEQICVNDGADPEYMKRIQRDNYLYRSKEECCQNHFWWRIAQCMGNEHPLYYSNGEICEQKVNMDQWEVKYSPQTWDASDLFETLEECCNAKFWWDVKGCISKSPKEVVFDFTFDVTSLLEPGSCQDADTIGKALEVALNVGLGGGTSNVTTIGCATLSRNPETSNPECGGCLAGTSFSGTWDGTRDATYYNYDPNQVTTISVEVSAKCDATRCPDAAGLETLYNEIVAGFKSFFESGQLETEIHDWAGERAPPVPELFQVQVVTSSFVTDGTFTNPLANPEDAVEATQVTTTGTLSVPSLNEEVTVVEVTTTGSFTVSNLNLSGLDATQTATMTGYFEDALIQELESQGALPAGSTVTVTSIVNGVVNFSITTYGDSSAETTAAVTGIQSALTTSTSDITSYVVAAAGASSDSDIISAAPATTSVNTFTPGTTTSPTTTSKVTVEGEFTVSNFSPGSFTSDQETEAMNFFEKAITSELESQGLLPKDATVVVTGLNNDGSVQYEVHFYGTSSEDTSAAITGIQSSLSQADTLSDISNAVVAESSTSVTGITNSFSAVEITENSQLGTTGVTMTAAELEEAKDLFEKAIIESLGTNLPEGSSVTITEIKDGVVSYEITMNAGTSAAANTAVSTIQTSLASAATLAAITTSITTPTVGVSMPGELTVTGLNPSTMTAAQQEAAMASFEKAIASALADDLPPGSTVVVTGLENGSVSYFITMDVASSAAATDVVNDLQASLGDTETLAAITTSVTKASSTLSGVSVASNIAMTPTHTEYPKTLSAVTGVTVASNVAGTTTESTVAKATTSGQLTTNLSGLSSAEILEVSDYFEAAIAATLEKEGALPKGAYVTVTDIAADGTVSYTITMHLPLGADNAVVVNGINSKLGSASTLTTISSAVASEATSSGSSITAVLSSLNVSGFIEGKTTGVSFKQWYPNWLEFGKYCTNDGNQPPFMTKADNAGDYLYATQAECCDVWYSYAKDCKGSPSSDDPNMVKFYPNHEIYGCSKKTLAEFGSWEQNRYDTLYECCHDNFKFSKQQCCDSPGMGGCGNSGVIVYMPDWENRKCVPREKETISEFEEEWARTSQSECCSQYFPFSNSWGVWPLSRGGVDPCLESSS